MDFLIEILFDLIFEGSIELSSNKKVPKWIRYTLITIIVLFFTVVMLGLLIIGISVLNKNLYGGLILIVSSLIFIILGIFKFKKNYIKRKNK